MKRNLILLALLASLGGCASMRSDPSTEVLAQVGDMATGAMQTQPAIVELNGRPALLYANKDNRVVFQYGKQRQLLDETAPVRGGNRFQLKFQEQNLHALWWSHQDNKNLYFTSSVDSGQRFAPVSIVNDDHGVLAPFSLLRGKQGVVGMTYLDERQPRFQTYFNRSTDYGRTWSRPDQRLDISPGERQATEVRDPQSVESGAAWVSAWVDAVQLAGRTTYRIVHRHSQDEGLNWSPPAVIHTSDKLISSLIVGSQGSQIVIAGDEFERGILAFASPDQGRSWRASGLLAGTGVAAGSEGANNSGIRMAVAGERAHLVWMQDRSGAKTKIMRASLDVAQSKWLDSAQRLDVKTHDNTRSILPVVLAVAQGPLLTAWVDYRDIRPNIYVSASFDQGQAWSAPQALLKPGEASAGWPRLIPWRDQAAIAYEVYPNERLADGQFILKQIALDKDAKALPDFGNRSQVSEAERKAKLEQRINTLWERRITGNYDSAYDMFDFAYRAATPKKNYLENVGVITYQAFSLNDLVIAGNEASANMKIKYEVKPTMLPTGKSITVAPVEVEADNKWVWVGNDWYLVYSPAYGQQNLKY